MLFLDLVTPFVGGGGVDATLYRRIMADHHLRGSYDRSAGSVECTQVALMSSSLENVIAPAFATANQRPIERAHAATHFSFVGYNGDLAFVELKTSEATYCELYRQSSVSFQRVREVRFPSHE